MPDTEKIYNLQYLATYTGIDINEGIEQNKKSRRDYFKELSLFENDTKEIMDTILEKRNKKALLCDLSSLQQKLFSIGDTAIMPKVEVLILMTKRNAPFAAIAEKAYEVRNSVKNLIIRIKEADVTSGCICEDEAIKPAPEPLTAKEPEPIVPVNPELINGIIKMMEDFDFQGAEKAVRELLASRLEPHTEWFLKKSADCFDESDFRGARDAIRELLQAIEKKEGDSKRESELNAKDESSKKAKKEAHKRAREEFEERISGKAKILAIDDVPDVLTGIKEMLKDRYSVYCVTNHLAALKFVTAGKPDLILLDIEMPEMSGFELLKLLRQMEACRNTPVIFLTGNVSIKNVKTAVESGGNDFIKKPVDVKLLVEKIEKHIRAV